MPACSDPTYEPGPVAAVDLGGFDGTLEPPVMQPIAQSFADQSGAWLSTLDASVAALEAETAIDVGGDIVSGLSAIPTSAAAAINAEALGHLQDAETGYEAARGSIGELKSWLPPDILQTQFVKILVFIVTDASGARLPGATATIDVNIGQGTTRTTNADGLASFEVPPGVAIGWSVTAPGAPTLVGVASSPADSDPSLSVTVRVTLPV